MLRAGPLLRYCHNKGIRLLPGRARAAGSFLRMVNIYRIPAAGKAGFRFAGCIASVLLINSMFVYLETIAVADGF